MALLDNLNDPIVQAKLMMAAGLLSPVRNKGWRGAAEALGQGVQQGLLGYTTGARTQEAVKRGEMERQLEQARLDKMKQAQEAQAYMGQGIGKFMSPGVTPATPVDDSGNAMPSSPPSFNQAGFAQYLAQNPATAAQALQYMPKPKEPFKLGKSDRLIDPNTNKEIIGPSPEDWQNPQWVETQKAIRAAGRPQVTVDTRQETEFSKEIGKQSAKDYGDLMKSGAMAQSKMTKLDRLSSLLSQSGATGKLTPATVELKAAAESLGFKVDPKLPFQQAAQALSNEIALELRNPAGGAGMPGALSDRDREFLVSMVPNLGKTAEGNKMLIETMKKLAQREAQVAKMAREYKAKTGKFDDGFYQELQTFSESNPMFAQPSKAPPSTAPKAGTVDGGYVFMGGDPADPKNWKKR